MRTNTKLENQLQDRLIVLLATWFGCGRVSKAPGTVGTLAAIPLIWTFGQFGLYGYMLAAFTFVVASVLIAHLYLERFPENQDPSEIVIDEVAGFLITMTWLPFTWQWLALGFVLFRILDILKPYPISLCDQKIKGGLGVVADDLLAGIIASIILQVVFANGWLS